ncbi:MAG: hypothetical protein FWB98_08945 [Defluviitaleaceae bacterium]|nr:hypothetical protein [Defluviitaleaceae bacterium]
MKVFVTYIMAWVIFTQIFSSGMDFVPQNVEILSIWIDDGVLTLNLSEDVMNYGGTYFEYRFINILFESAAKLRYPRYLTILVEGRATYLPEGVKIFREPLH